MKRLLRRLLVLAVLAGVATAVMRRLGGGGGECGPGCDCSQGAEACDCGHATCLAPAQA